MLKRLFFTLIVRPFVLLVFGIHVQGQENIPTQPCILVANHNSHLDTMVLMSLFPLRTIHRIRPVAAVDYFMIHPFVRWFSTHIIGIIPLQRKVEKSHAHPLDGIKNALLNGNSVIIFPEGSRGEAEQMCKFKTGIAHLAHMVPHIPIIPIRLGGAGKVLPKGEALLVPFIIDITIAPSVHRGEDEGTQEFTQRLENIIKGMGIHCSLE